jgi:GT2 family glycosyltransferase
MQRHHGGLRGDGEDVDVSICMVSLDCWHVLENCLRSIPTAAAGLNYEIIVVDNASADGTPENLALHFPEVRVIRNDANVGFSRATNQGLEVSRGRQLLWLNTDTILQADSIAALVRFLDAHPAAGVVGPKVLNADGTFQPQCRRGMPVPAASLAYMLGLHRLWPRNRRFGQYLLSHLSPDERNPVTAVSGCCLLARREVWNTVGPIDEEIFGFGEDIEWCVRAAKVGWQVWYEPASVITHLKGQGGVHTRPYRKIFGIHQAMWVFYRKHLRSEYNPFVTVLVGAGVALSYLTKVTLMWLRRRLDAGRRKSGQWIAYAHGQRSRIPGGGD